jgi:4-hydroxy-3-methylbut-2-enyl diphosphate reductase
MTRVLIDRHAGFCAGVKRAIRGARRVSRAHGGAVSLGELIHNPQVVGELEREGIRVIREVPARPGGEPVILRAHGIPPAEEERLRERGIAYHDFTCPRVQDIHRTITACRQEGWRILIVGNRDHPEVKGHLGYAGEAGAVLSSVREAEEYTPPIGPQGLRLVVLAQTTIAPELFRQVIGVLERKRAAAPARTPGGSFSLRTLDTICPFVLRRQEWIRRASRKARASLVIGGRNSSNTRKLVEIAERNGPVFWIERPEELPVEELLRHPVVALTAGASTPDQTIREVVERLAARGALIE